MKTTKQEIGRKRGQQLAKIADIVRDWIEDKSQFKKPFHGPCCCCQRCGWDIDECVCFREDIHLHHILGLLPKFAYSCVKGFIEFQKKPQFFTRTAIYWKLNMSLTGQDDETIDFLYNVICDFNNQK